ncbi:MAG: cytochrome c oxidase assembly factor Coa1 family protein, partial [Hyphomicrobiaceae bacterium]
MPYPGQPKDTPIPTHLNKWNWGACLLNWIWGIGNSTYRAFLIFIPIYGFYMLYRLGRNGNRWAWQHRLW